MKFLEYHERLRLETWRRIDQGILSSSLLARQTGLTQPHISNFLHGRRRLSLAALDRILQAQTLRVEDLSADELSLRLSGYRTMAGDRDVVPIVSPAVAMTAPLIAPRFIADYIELPRGWVTGIPTRQAANRNSWERFVAVRVAPTQALPADPVLRVGSLVVLDRHYSSLSALKAPHPNLYGVRLGAHLLFRHVVFESGRLILRPRALESPLEVIEVASRTLATNLIVGRVCLCVAQL
jgi:transcriptional regulator with XRE-family HTH domain